MVAALREEGYNRQESIELLYARIEALEAAQQPQQDKLNRLIAEIEEDAQPTGICPAPPAPAGELVKRVAMAIGDDSEPMNWAPEARAAIREVAKWLDGQIEIGAAHILRQEANR